MADQLDHNRIIKYNISLCQFLVYLFATSDFNIFEASRSGTPNRISPAEDPAHSRAPGAGRNQRTGSLPNPMQSVTGAKNRGGFQQQIHQGSFNTERRFTHPLGFTGVGRKLERFSDCFSSFIFRTV